MAMLVRAQFSDVNIQGHNKALALKVDGGGQARYDAIVHQGRREGQRVQSQFKDLVPLAERDDPKDKRRSLERPSEKEVTDTADRTRLALEQIVQGKNKAAQPKNIATAGGTSYVRYTPASQGTDGKKQRIIKITDVVEDPLEPPKHQFKKIPGGPPSPPPPVLRLSLIHI